MAMSALGIDTSSSASFRVKPTDLASAISTDPQDEFPSVFATSGLVTILKITSVRVLKPYLEPGQLSVGVTVDVSHTAPTPGDALVTAEATYKAKEGKRFVFDVLASNEGARFGVAVHKRAVVDAQRLLVGAKKRVADSPSQSA
ncbi:Fluoroacetyl-CoA thioesterase [Colletotrichum siamense]|uniref:Fluoroacetyl-CoA thioesterase n=1 Tax=Colletotrichum siamense TaxID=690259 RepID=A0A9P5EQI6_COLSI|nr:Fluoroacetyl-CoA thioesterase [Colletotrichum siamense]KAF4857743.1 Fluoroacetyl-CoA thioesterase [Colletotrichum siamense]